MHAKLESFAHCLLISCIAVGAVLIMAAVSTSSAGERRRDYGVMESAWERVPGLSIFKRHPDDPRLNPAFVLALTGLTLIVVAFLL